MDISSKRRQIGALGLLIAAGLVLMIGTGATAISSLHKGDTQILEPASTEGEAFSDGHLSFAEYEAAINVALHCAAEQGVQVSTAEVGLDGVTLDYSIYEGSMGERAIAVFDECYDKHAHSVDLLFQTSDEVEAARAQYIAKMTECLLESTSRSVLTPEETANFIYPPDQPEPEYEDCRTRSLDAERVTVHTLDSNHSHTD